MSTSARSLLTQESHAVAVTGKPCDAAVNFDQYRVFCLILLVADDMAALTSKVIS